MKLLVIGDFHGNFSKSFRQKILRENFDLVVALGDYAGIKEWRPYLKEMFKSAKNGKSLKAEDYFGKRRYKLLIKKDERRAKLVLREINKLGKPVIAIFGNNDDEWYDYPFQSGLNAKKSRLRFAKRLKNFSWINYSTKHLQNFSFLGFGGYMDVLANHQTKKLKGVEKERFERARLRDFLAGKRLFKVAGKLKGHKIFVFHYPPKGAFDLIHEKGNPYNGKSAGIASFREAISRFKPIVAFCGHMHEYQDSKLLGKTIVVNPGDAGSGRYAIVEILQDRVNVKFEKC